MHACMYGYMSSGTMALYCTSVPCITPYPNSTGIESLSSLADVISSLNRVFSAEPDYFPARTRRDPQYGGLRIHSSFRSQGMYVCMNCTSYFIQSSALDPVCCILTTLEMYFLTLCIEHTRELRAETEASPTEWTHPYLARGGRRQTEERERERRG